MVRTAGYIKWTDLGIDNPECSDYTPIEYCVPSGNESCRAFERDAIFR
jgi:hypothetical protein